MFQREYSQIIESTFETLINDFSHEYSPTQFSSPLISHEKYNSTDVPCHPNSSQYRSQPKKIKSIEEIQSVVGVKEFIQR